MMFKVGDKVKVLFSECGAPPETFGKAGTVFILDMEDKNGISFCVKFEDSYHGSDSWWYTDEELSHIEEA